MTPNRENSLNRSNLLDDGLDEFPEVVVVIVRVDVVDQLGDHFSVGVGFELVTFSLKMVKSLYQKFNKIFVF